jgi:hypothetical protein
MLSSTFCASGANSLNSLAGLRTPVVSVPSFMSSKITRRSLYPPPRIVSDPVLTALDIVRSYRSTD